MLNNWFPNISKKWSMAEKVTKSRFKIISQGTSDFYSVEI
jgi:hypothetical protein